MTDNERATIGLNETKLGIVAPFWFAETLVNTVGFRRSERLLQLGELVTPQQALAIGLVDEVVPTADVVPRAVAAVEELLKLNDWARASTKAMLRAQTVRSLAENRDADVRNFVDFATSAPVQASLEQYVAMLKSRKK